MEFTVAVFKFCRTLPASDEARDVARQLRRAASSVAANCRAMKRSASDRIFAAKSAVIIEEADEAGFWLELLVRVEIVVERSVTALRTESNELVAIFTASRKTVVARMREKKRVKGR
jgi:four helix bundle protein